MRPIFILDIGNVLVKICYDNLVSEMIGCGFFNNKEQAVDFINSVEGVLCSGIMNERQCLDFAFPRYSKAHKERILDAWRDVFELNLDMIDFFNDELVILASNISEGHVKELKSRHDIFIKKRGCFSCEIGASKPSYMFFEYLSREYAELAGGKDVIYIDDKIDNLTAGKKWIMMNRNVHGILFDLEKNTPDELFNFLIESDKIYYNAGNFIYWSNGAVNTSAIHI